MSAVPSSQYCVNVPLRWSDMDAYGHVNNVQFLRLLEDARVTGFQDWFGRDKALLEEGVLVSRHEIEYIAPLTFRHADRRGDVGAPDRWGGLRPGLRRARSRGRGYRSLRAGRDEPRGLRLRSVAPRRIRPDERSSRGCEGPRSLPVAGAVTPVRRLLLDDPQGYADLRTFVTRALAGRGRRDPDPGRGTVLAAYVGVLLAAA